MITKKSGVKVNNNPTQHTAHAHIHIHTQHSPGVSKTHTQIHMHECMEGFRFFCWFAFLPLQRCLYTSSLLLSLPLLIHHHHPRLHVPPIKPKTNPNFYVINTINQSRSPILLTLLTYPFSHVLSPSLNVFFLSSVRSPLFAHYF
jgi:hypothetical protein